MRILVIANSDSIHTNRYVNEFQRQGHELLLLSANYFLGFNVQYNKEVQQVSYLSFVSKLFLKIFKKQVPKFSRAKSKFYHPFNFLILFRMIYLWFAINRVLKKESFDAIFAINLTTNGIFAARVKRKVNKVCLTLGCDLKIAKWNSVNIIINNKYTYKYVERKLDFIITGEEKFYYDFFANKKIFHHPHKIIRFKGLGVDTDLFNPNKKSVKLKKGYYGLNKGSILAVCYRQPRPTLDFSTIIKTLGTVIKKHTNFYFAIGTGGQDYPNLKKIAVDNNIERNILFMPSIPYEKLHLYLAQADIFIDPVNIKKNPEVESAGISGAVLESMACGLIPVIGNRPGLETYFTDELSILIYDDMEKDLSNYIEKAISNIHNATLKENLRNIVLNGSSWNTNIKRIMKLLFNGKQKNSNPTA